MANEKRSDPRKNFVLRFLPWLLAAATFTVFGFTLNHWVSLTNLGTVAKTSGWTWQPSVYNPLFVTVTYPFRWLPVGLIPVALNLFAAACAALTLALLARSVAILPHDRTDAQRKRERGELSFLTIGSAWLPPVLAVLVCALQMTFWEQATNSSPEMFDLLLFAFVIWSLLEYRLDGREDRLFLAAIVYGAGMAENWAMIGFLPFFIGSIVWIRGLNFFRWRFIQRMFLCGLVGMLAYLILPLAAALSHKVPLTFWQVLKANLAAQWDVVKAFFVQPEVRKAAMLLSPASLLSVLLLSIHWKSSGDNSKTGLAVTSLMTHLIHGFLLIVCIWVAFDPPFSPRFLGLGLPFLTFYYLGALSVGYYSGYFLLVFGKDPEDRSRRQAPDPYQSLNRLVVAGVWLLAAFTITGLAYKNIPQIREANDDTFKNLGNLTIENLPREGGILLSDDSSRLILTEAALARDGRIAKFVPVETSLLAMPSYHRYLHEKFPLKWPDTIVASEETNGVSPLHLIRLLATIARTNDLYYLHPSFGYYFEQFYAEPHGMVYKLNTLPNDTLLPPAPDKNQFTANETFWTQAEKLAFAPIIAAVTPAEPQASQSFGEKLLNWFHVARKPGPNAAIAGAYYSRSLNSWGVQCQRAGYLTNAAAHFALAEQLNPENVVARVNLDFNQILQAGDVVSIDPNKAPADQLGHYRSWSDVVTSNGPFDEPTYCFRSAVLLAAQNGFIRQAVEPFERVRQLVPDNLPVRLWLARSYLASRLPDRALDVLNGPLNHPESFALTTTNSSEVNIMAAAAYFQKDDNARGIQFVQTEISRQPTNEVLLLTAVQVYLSRGLYSNAMSIIDRQLHASPEDPKWLFGKGYAAIQMKDYNEAIPPLTRLLSIQSTNYDALFNRAVAYLQSGQLDAARADYKALGQTFTNSFQVAYGLGEIAWRKNETNEAIRHYEDYLATANTNTAEATNIIERLKSLKR